MFFKSYEALALRNIIMFLFTTVLKCHLHILNIDYVLWRMHCASFAVNDARQHCASQGKYTRDCQSLITRILVSFSRVWPQRRWAMRTIILKTYTIYFSYRKNACVLITNMYILYLSKPKHVFLNEGYFIKNVFSFKTCLLKMSSMSGAQLLWEDRSHLDGGTSKHWSSALVRQGEGTVYP